MLRTTALALSAAIPSCLGMGMPVGVTEDHICESGLCAKPSLAYETILPGQPGIQWNDAGGYCGSFSIQRATLTRGAYISQEQVRNHTVAGGGNDNEILSTNIEEAFRQLKLDTEGFDYVNNTAPMQDVYFRWLKKQLVSGNPVTWMIMWSGQSYPIYGLTPPAGLYGHVEPVMGIMSNYALTDEEVYDDDVVVHFTDGGLNTVYRNLKSMAGDWTGPVGKANCHSYRYCIGPYSFGWAIKDFKDTRAGALPAYLHINPSRSEPDTRSGERPNQLKGTLTVSGGLAGQKYNIYRWDSVEEAFTYDAKYIVKTFVAPQNGDFVFADPNTFRSNGLTYYRVHLA